MKAGRVSNGLIYVMGVDPGGTSGVAIIGVHGRTIYGDHPGKISYFETFDVTGGESNQALEIVDASREFYPLALVVESFYPAKPITSDEYLSPVRVGAKIELCVDVRYVICQLFWQTPSQAMQTANDSRLKLWGLYKPGPDHIKDATRHAITFIRRAKDDQQLRERAWGPGDQLRRQVASATRVANRRTATQGNNPTRSAQQNGGYRTGARRGITRARRTLYLTDE